jgi:hypothetical protein
LVVCRIEALKSATLFVSNAGTRVRPQWFQLYRKARSRKSRRLRAKVGERRRHPVDADLPEPEKEFTVEAADLESDPWLLNCKIGRTHLDRSPHAIRTLTAGLRLVKREGRMGRIMQVVASVQRFAGVAELADARDSKSEKALQAYLASYLFSAFCLEFQPL